MLASLYAFKIVKNSIAKFFYAFSRQFMKSHISLNMLAANHKCLHGIC